MLLYDIGANKNKAIGALMELLSITEKMGRFETLLVDTYYYLLVLVTTY